MAPATTKARRKPAVKKHAAEKKTTPPKAVETPVEEPIAQEYDPAWHATVEAYVTLRDAGAQIPDAIRIPVEKWLAEQEQRYRAEEAKKAEAAAKQQEADLKGPKWIRARLSAEFALRIGRRDKDKSRRIQLTPRGQRGDLFPLEPGDENDPDLRASLRDGYIELLGDTAANEVIQHQVENIHRVHAPLAMLTNERGERPEGGFKVDVEQEFNRQGVVVGVIDKGETQRHGLGQIYRPEQVQRFFPTGGNPAIVSSGFEPKLSEDARASIADDLARRKGVQGRPEDVLSLNVSVEPTRRT